jgi:hypothetical protein
MTRTASALLVAGALLSAVTSVNAAPKVLGFPFNKEVRRDVPHLDRRQKSVEVTVDNAVIQYFINVTIGTPPQPLTLALDTGSSDIWIPSAQSDYCVLSRQGCLLGEFDSFESSTFVEVAQNLFQIEYVDGTEIQGDYVQDVLTIGDRAATLQNMTMGLASTASIGYGIMGIGYSAGESIARLDPNAIYPNVIDLLVEQGVINSRAYSIYLNDINSASGNILFGGVDTDKYSGDLIALPVQRDARSNGFTRLSVAFTGLSVMGASGNSQLTRDNIAVPVVLDTGATITYLPDDLANDVLQGVGVTTDPTYGNVVRCSIGRQEATFAFAFGGQGGPSINVSLSQLVIPIPSRDGSPTTFQDGSEACLFGIDAAGDNPVIFGDTFMRSAYVVYDLDKNQIALAQARFDVSTSNIQEFSAGGSIPGVNTVASQVQVTLTYTGPLRTQEATGTASGSVVVGTQRTATFSLTAATTTSGVAPGSNSGSMTVRPLEGTTILAAVVALASFMFGGGLIIYI